MIHTVKQIFSLFSKRERLSLVGVIAAMLAMGIMQMLGIGVVLPFVSLLSDPGQLHSNAFLDWGYTTFGFETNRAFLIALGSVLLFVLVGSNAVTAVTIWLLTRFTWRVQCRISTRLLSGYLRQPYEAFLNRNTADIGKNVLQESQQFANGVLMPLLKVCAFTLSASMIVGFLLWIKPVIALLVAALFVGAYVGVFLTIRRMLKRVGQERMQANTERFQAVNEAFGSVKEVKVLGREDAFLNRYIPAADRFAHSNIRNQVMQQIPRFFIEAMAFGLIMAAMLIMLAGGYDLKASLPIASAFVLAGYRLLPALQNVYGGVSSLRFNQAVLDTLIADLNRYVVSNEKPPDQVSTSDEASGERRPARFPSKLAFENAITLEAVDYRYPNAPRPSLIGVSIEIPRNSFVALTGATGAGKTTLADIVLGLLTPTSGEMLVDEVPVTTENAHRWQANIGYVPQDIYLTDSTIAGNIAYGVPNDDIDSEAVARAARIANIHDFIVDKLPDGYETTVGERGVRLSGGQRQRIGIARALYHDPGVIVLDEATSALDNETERRIVNELDAMRGGRTLIVIAHRLSTVEKCHQVFYLRDGQIESSGTYNEVLGRKIANG